MPALLFPQRKRKFPYSPLIAGTKPLIHLLRIVKKAQYLWGQEHASDTRMLTKAATAKDYFPMDIMTFLTSPAPSDDRDADEFSQSLQTMPTEEILNVWASSQALSMTLQKTFLPAAKLHSATEDLIILELVRRQLQGSQRKPRPVAAMERDALADKPRELQRTER